MRPSSRRLSLMFSAIVLGCGDGGMEPDPLDLTGFWSISWTRMSGSGVSCYTSAILFQVTQSDETFTGNSETRWTLTCSDGTESVSQRATGAALTDGRVDDAGGITFNLTSSAFQQTGKISGSSMSGPATWTLGIGPDTYMLVGQFSGRRQ